MDPAAIERLLHSIAQTPIAPQDGAETGFDTLADTPAGAQMMAALIERLDMNDDNDNDNDDGEGYDSDDL
jgi:hypothetical protein